MRFSSRVSAWCHQIWWKHSRLCFRADKAVGQEACLLVFGPYAHWGPFNSGSAFALAILSASFFLRLMRFFSAQISQLFWPGMAALGQSLHLPCALAIFDLFSAVLPPVFFTFWILASGLLVSFAFFRGLLGPGWLGGFRLVGFTQDPVVGGFWACGLLCFLFDVGSSFLGVGPFSGCYVEAGFKEALFRYTRLSMRLP